MAGGKQLLSANKTYYKANLHTHTTVSDGKLTPEEAKAHYKALGYSILALTDHDVIVDHSGLNDKDFLTLTGAEIDISETEFVPGVPFAPKSRHLCMIAKEPHNLWLPFENPYTLPSSRPYLEDITCDTMERLYTPEQFNAILKKTNEQGFLVTYNHPTWSLESYPDYAPMQGLWGVEYRNSGCIAEGYDENNGRVYQDLLMLGNRIMPVFADDMHSISKDGIQVLGASWIMVGADALTYPDVIQALEQGDLYASCGPQITALTWEGGTLRVSCSPAAQVQVVTQTRFAGIVAGTDICQAEFDMNKWLRLSQGDTESFLRVIVTAEDGAYAVSRAYRLDELEG